VVNATYSTQASSSSSTYADTGLTATITPTSASSKILVQISQTGLFKNTGAAYMGLRVLRGATTIATFEVYAGDTGTSTPSAFGGSSTNYLDSPTTTSATTYKTQFASGANNAQVGCQYGGCTSTITLLEVAA
jgi:hypothetical protein